MITIVFKRWPEYTDLETVRMSAVPRIGEQVMSTFYGSNGDIYSVKHVIWVIKPKYEVWVYLQKS